MAIHGPWVNGYITINSVNLTARCKSAVWNDAYDSLDISAFGNTAHVVRPGLANGTLTCEFMDDLAASGDGSVEATLSALVGSATPVPVTLKADSGTIAATNPERQANAILLANPFGGAHGGLLSKSVTFNLVTVTTRDITP
jgi:hypothetical protein